MYFALLDILRFISSVAVFIHHTFSFHYGKLGVYLFFIISGFVIYFSIQKGMKDYLVGRFIRLFPLFWVCCTLTYLVTLLYGVNLPLKNYLIGMLMFNDGKIASMVDGSYWTLTFELLFYFYMAVFVSFFSVRNIVWFYTFWLTVSAASFYFGFDQNIVAKLLSVRFVPYFVFGGVLALIVDNYKKSKVSMRSLYLFLLFSSALLPLYVSNKLQHNPTITNFTGSFDFREMMIVESFFIIIPLTIYLSRFKFASHKKLVDWAFLLGGITYPLYLLHWKIGATIIGPVEDYGHISKFSFSIAVLIFITALLLSIYELPVRKKLRLKLHNYLENKTKAL